MPYAAFVGRRQVARWNALGATPSFLRAGRACSARHRHADDGEHDGRLYPPAHAGTTGEHRACLERVMRHPYPLGMV